MWRDIPVYFVYITDPPHRVVDLRIADKAVGLVGLSSKSSAELRSVLCLRGCGVILGWKNM